MYLLVQMPEIKSKNAFRAKQTTNLVPSNIFRILEDGKIEEITYLQAEKQQTRYRLTYSEL